MQAQPPLTIREFFEKRGRSLQLALLAGSRGLDKHALTVPDIYRPGLALAGYFNYFAFERVQVMGRTELSYLDSLAAPRRQAVLKQFFSYPVACIILTQGLKPSALVARFAERKGVPLFCSQMATTRLVSELALYLEERLAPRTTVHGTLVEVYGLGVLLQGKSGIGKSECALELVKRGHRLVADDLVHLSRTSEPKVMGWGDELIRHHMEVRGLGIIDVKELFGVGAVRQDVPVDLMIMIEEWQDEKEYDRMGLDEQCQVLLDVPVPCLLLPVRPGRSLAVILEVAAMNQRLKKAGVYSAEVFNQKVLDWMGKAVPKKGKARRRARL
jgi:HPr kinase/phosphorylase